MRDRWKHGIAPGAVVLALACSSDPSSLVTHKPRDGATEGGVNTAGTGPQSDPDGSTTGAGGTSSAADGGITDAGALVPEDDGGAAEAGPSRCKGWTAVGIDGPPTGCSRALEGARCFTLPVSRQLALLGPGADLRGVDLRGISLPEPIDLHGADLTCAELDGAEVRYFRAYDLPGCPASLPDGWKCVEQPRNGRYALVGPDADLNGADLRGAELSGSDLSRAPWGAIAYALAGCQGVVPDSFHCVFQPASGGYALAGGHMDLRGADLSGADLSGVRSTSSLEGTNLTGAKLDGAQFANLLECPSSLPDDWLCVVQPSNGVPLFKVLVGPGADLEGVDLTRTDLKNARLDGARGLHAHHLQDCPASLPDARWRCVGTPGNYTLVGPGAFISYADLTNADLSDATLDGVRATELVGCPAKLPSAHHACLWNGRTWELVGPRMRLGDLRGTDLSSVDLTGATGGMTTRLRACPAQLPGPASRCFLHGSPGEYVLLAPDAVLYAADLSGADFQGASLKGAHITNVDLSDADLSGVDLRDAMVSANLNGARLSGVNLAGAYMGGTLALDLRSCPAVLPGPEWRCVAQPVNGRFILVGPQANLSGANLAGADLSGAAASDLVACPAALPGPGWLCAQLAHDPRYPPDRFALVGPGANLRSADLREASLQGADLSGAELGGAITHGLLGCPSTLPGKGWVCLEHAFKQWVLAGPGVDLSHSDMTDVNLRAGNMTGVTWTNAYCPDGTFSVVNDDSCEGHL